jgi:protein SCO1/2
MHRRAYLGSVGGAASSAVTAAAGCLALGDTNPDVVLSEPDRPFDSEDVPYPAWGERVPDVTLPAPLDGREVDLRAVQTPRLLTFFYSHCMTVCPVLISRMKQVQQRAQEDGYCGEVAFFPVTFDPERDDADRLASYGEKMNVDSAASCWQFLRPESRERAREVVERKFGVAFQRTTPEEGDGYMFAHTALTVLVNAEGYVERAYQTKSPDVDRMTSDLKRVRDA